MNINDLKKIGTVIKLNDEPYIVLSSQHARTAQRKAFIRTKLRNLNSGIVLEKTFQAGDKIEEADLEKRKASYLYQQNDQYFFMDQKNFDQFSLNKNSLAGQEKFLKEGLGVVILFFEGQPINLELPKKIDLKVIQAPPGVKGDSATAATKIITLETGLEINAPLFIKEGDTVRVNTETGEYVERV